jgi:heavy metal translocating P-type ATPase
MIGARWVTVGLLIATSASLIIGLVLRVLGAMVAADTLWIAVSVLALIPLLVDTLRQLLRRQAGVDLIAILALVGALAFGEYLAAAVIGLMLATGSALEQYAAGRAERELSELLKRAPRTAHRVDGDAVSDISIDDVRVGDRLLVKEGDTVPVDGEVLEPATLDESALTGESRLVTREVGDALSSGVVNAGAAFQMRAGATAEASTYAGIIRLVRSAQEQKSPFTRLADRYAALFVPLTLGVAGVAWWVSGDPVRALAVLVVATPCPLLLAAPIAMVSGISRCARRGIIVRDGGALEALAQARTFFFDKTGTLTEGAPRVSEVVAVDGWDAAEVLRLAASLDQVSSHVLAAAIVREAVARGLALSMPSAADEVAGGGLSGEIDGRAVMVGSARWVLGQSDGDAAEVRRRLMLHGGSGVVVAVDARPAGVLLLDDAIRLDTSRTVRALKRLGIHEVVMLTGDRAEAASAVGAAIGVDRILAEQSPESKVEAVLAAHARGETTAMVGDGINDAAALASADVGVAMGARGATASSEAADIVIAVDRLDRLEEAVRLAQRTRRVAQESVFLGMGLAFLAMAAAAAGLLAPVGGALLQEGIDAAAILWALRALRPIAQGRVRSAVPASVIAELQADHRAIEAEVDRLRSAAEALDALDGQAAAELLTEMGTLLEHTLLEHERADEERVYPLLAASLEGDDPLAPLSRTHHELEVQVGQFAASLRHISPDGPTVEQRIEFQRILYGLYAILRLHNAQEDELFHELIDA